MNGPVATINGVGIKLAWPEHHLHAILSRFNESGGTTKAEVAFHLSSGETSQLLTQATLNLSSLQGRAGFARRLSELCPAISWDDVLENVAVHGMRLHREGDPVVRLQAAPSAHVPFLVNPLIYRGYQSLFYAPGGSLKSFIGLYLALVACHGARQNGLAAIKCPVLYLDWELNADTVGGRLRALQAGHPDLRQQTPYYRRCDAPLHQDVAAIANSVAEHEVELLILDSAAMACGGDLNSPDTVIKLTRALRTIGCSSLLLAHISKLTPDGAERSAYGSVYFRELARNVWELERAEGDEEGPVRVLLSQKKNNFGKSHAPLGFEFTFTDEAVRIVGCDPEDEPAFEPKLPLASRIRNLLEDGELWTAHEIADELNAKLGSVKFALSKHRGLKWQKVGNNRDAKWTCINR